MSAAHKQMPEEQAVALVRNALLVAGMEMGAEGDHWPAIKSTIHSVVKDWEDLKTERNVDAELKKHLYKHLSEMEAGIAQCDAKVRAEVAPLLSQLREIYDAYFSDAADEAVMVYENEEPVHLQRARIILDTLEDEDVA